MSQRVIYTYFDNNEHIYLVDYLHNNYSWKPVFFAFGIDEIRNWAQEVHPDAVCADSMAMRQSNFDYSRIGQPVPVDEKIISALSKHESTYLNWLQDTTGWNFSFQERRRYFYDILKYWNTVINNLKPDLFVAYTFIHLPSDYPLYLLCKYYYDIPVLYFNPIPFLDDEYYCIADSMVNLSSPFEKTYLSNDILKTSDAVIKYLETLRSSKAQIPKHITNGWEKLRENTRAKPFDYWILLKIILRGKLFKDARLSFKKNKKPWDSEASKLTNFDYFVLKKYMTWKNKSIQKKYKKISKPPLANETYIYFAAPYQPEAMSNLLAGVYEDVFLTLDIISQVIPDDWVIYYKEHPGFFEGGEKLTLMRSANFYHKVNSYKNIKIIPYNTNTFTLIDGSQGVCTVGGTVGWEAIVRGKPVLAFGGLWYQSCRSVFTINSYQDAQKAIKEIVNGFTPDQNDVDRYAEAIYRACEHGLIAPRTFAETIRQCDNPQYEMERIAKKIASAFKSYYSKNSK